MHNNWGGKITSIPNEMWNVKTKKILKNCGWIAADACCMNVPRVRSGRRSNFNIHPLLFGSHESLQCQRDRFDGIRRLVGQFCIFVQRWQRTEDGTTPLAYSCATSSSSSSSSSWSTSCAANAVAGRTRSGQQDIQADFTRSFRRTRLTPSASWGIR